MRIGRSSQLPSPASNISSTVMCTMVVVWFIQQPSLLGCSHFSRSNSIRARDHAALSVLRTRWWRRSAACAGASSSRCWLMRWWST